ncbi:hypothetical protein ACFSKI_19245 [Pseudogracilibacillus auburnensis]|uniref:PH (Pleckstrin Homology) domain-containing protein n=1 Tax=Pseudogracilibacillus auburnensis TaxID=1494959 RepID=A0A2V3W9D4_9BACI|nr:hypothetical protein [Pseudogracilibacillus auburnensis]PXW88835.1 hypothetical protein DFR56_103341 [Pseudogracilibacillus auburnensis]
MHQEVFKKNFFVVIILPVAIFVIMSIAFRGIYSIDGSVPIWVLVFYIIPVAFAIGGQVEKVIVEDGMLYYKHGFIIKKQDEVSLNEVSRIEVRAVKEWVKDSDGKSELKTNKYAYVLGESGQIFFTFNADFIRKRNRQRFEDAVTTFNPTIEVS